MLVATPIPTRMEQTNLSRVISTYFKSWPGLSANDGAACHGSGLMLSYEGIGYVLIFVKIEQNDVALFCALLRSFYKRLRNKHF